MPKKSTKISDLGYLAFGQSDKRGLLEQLTLKILRTNAVNSKRLLQLY